MPRLLIMAMMLQAANAPSPVANPAPQPAVRAQVVKESAPWITANDYPASALRDNLEGVVGFTLAIDEAGNVRTCTVTAASPYPILDQTTCYWVKKRARFIPARDASGNPASDVFQSQIKWTAPHEVAEPGPLEKSTMLQISYIVEPDGTRSHCHVDRVEGADSALRRVGDSPCADMKSARGFLDEAGNPVRRKVTVTKAVSIDPVP